MANLFKAVRGVSNLSDHMHILYDDCIRGMPALSGHLPERIGCSLELLAEDLDNL